MGLDIYFIKRKKGTKELGDTDVAYFRKVNCLVKWVRDNVKDFDNCEEVELSKDDIIQLRDDAQKVSTILDKASFYNKEYETGCYFDKETNTRKIEIGIKKVYDFMEVKDIMNILPPESGFFFGNTDIDEYYFSDIKDIIKEMNYILESVDFDNYDLIFYCWW